MKDFKVCAQQKLYVVPLDINRQALLNLELTYADRNAIIFSLTVEDYCSGPEVDNDRAGSIWIFGKVVNGVEMYIKLKLVEYYPTGSSEPVREAKCLSFHPSSHLLNYPFQKNNIQGEERL